MLRQGKLVLTVYKAQGITVLEAVASFGTTLRQPSCDCNSTVGISLQGIALPQHVVFLRAVLFTTQHVIHP